MTYIVAVSGGVDSMVLLDMIATGSIDGISYSASDIIVAHVDHGIRVDSKDDAKLVADRAATYGYRYETVRFELGTGASEDEAREKRYAWLWSLCKQYDAIGIITAHHQDDVIETICINIMRGTGWRGVASLRSRNGLYRPLLHMSKAEIIQYACDKELVWHEDSTNDDARYLRNYIRQTVMRALTPIQRRAMIEYYNDQIRLVDEIDAEVSAMLPIVRQKQGLDRYWLIMAGEIVAAEMVTAWTGHRFTRQNHQSLWHFMCTARPHKSIALDGITFQAITGELIVSPPRI